MAHSDSCNGGREISIGPVHGEGTRERKLKCDMRGVRAGGFVDVVTCTCIGPAGSL